MWTVPAPPALDAGAEKSKELAAYEAKLNPPEVAE
jgi:hypothetical protein